MRVGRLGGASIQHPPAGHQQGYSLSPECVLVCVRACVRAYYRSACVLYARERAGARVSRHGRGERRGRGRWWWWERRVMDCCEREGGSEGEREGDKASARERERGGRGGNAFIYTTRSDDALKSVYSPVRDAQQAAWRLIRSKAKMDDGVGWFACKRVQVRVHRRRNKRNVKYEMYAREKQEARARERTRGRQGEVNCVGCVNDGAKRSIPEA